jgi:hypothetical protein
MAKYKQLKRKRSPRPNALRKLQKLSGAITPPPNPSNPAEPKSLQTLIPDEELDTTIDTLNLLSGYPNILKSKACKDLRVAVYNFRQACTTGVNSARKL